MELLLAETRWAVLFEGELVSSLDLVYVRFPFGEGGREAVLNGAAQELSQGYLVGRLLGFAQVDLPKRLAPSEPLILQIGHSVQLA